MHPGWPLDIKSRIHEINVFLVQFFPQQLHCFTKTLEVDHFPLPEEFDHIIDIGIVGQPQDVVIGHPCFLLWYS